MSSHYKKFKPRSKTKKVIHFLCSKSTEHFMSVEGATDRIPEDGHATCRGGEGREVQYRGDSYKKFYGEKEGMHQPLVV